MIKINRIQGIKRSKKYGIYRNAKLKFTKYNKNLQNAFNEYLNRANNHMSMQVIAKTNHMSRSTLYKKIRKYHPSKSEVNFQTNHRAHSFSDWVGGKARPAELKPLIRHMPTNFDPQKNNFTEAFAGMASLAFAIKPKHLILNDTNINVINCFNSVKKHPNHLIHNLKRLQKNNSKAQFNHIKNIFNNDFTKRKASYFLYLTQSSHHCIMRFNKKGYINSAYGFKKPKFDFKNIQKASKFLNSTKLKLFNNDYFKTVLNLRLHKNDFIYFDPPYITGFKRYGGKKFNINDIIKLKNLCIYLAFKHVNTMVTNFDTPKIRDIFQGSPFHIYNHNKEVIITNY